MKVCPVCGKEGLWYTYNKTPDGTIFDVEGAGTPLSREEFEKKFEKTISNFTYGTGEVFLHVHECGHAEEIVPEV